MGKAHLCIPFFHVHNLYDVYTHSVMVRKYCGVIWLSCALLPKIKV